MPKLSFVDAYSSVRQREAEYDIVLAYVSSQLALDTLAPQRSEFVRIMLNRVRLSGLLFVYGDPNVVPYYGAEIERNAGDKGFVFKYYIAVRTAGGEQKLGIKPSHKALVLYAPADKFVINKVRVPHSFCKTCGQNLKDWGGKKHLMHPLGAALSDVWKDLEVPPEEELPKEILERVCELSVREAPRILLIRLPREILPLPSPLKGVSELTESKVNKVILGDCVEVMKDLPTGSVNLAFADPPYNLDKAYFSYDDLRHDEEYLTWCERWLYEYQRVLSLAGSLFVVNLPKWAIHHKVFLDKYLYFQNWIVWDALSEPRGRLMPAHYSILCYTKHPSRYTFNKEWATQLSSDFCIRATCVRKRQQENIDDRIILSDIWWDIPRIKHKRFRDEHPCQLPEKLMERIIGLASKPGDVVFDAFCGTGTTAVVAKRMGRRYLTIDIDRYYVDLTLSKLDLLDKCGIVPRLSTNRKRPLVAKKDLQLELLRLANLLGRLPTEADVGLYSKYPLEVFLTTFPSFGKALRAAKVHQESFTVT